MRKKNLLMTNEFINIVIHYLYIPLTGNLFKNKNRINERFLYYYWLWIMWKTFVFGSI